MEQYFCVKDLTYADIRRYKQKRLMELDPVMMKVISGLQHDRKPSKLEDIIKIIKTYELATKFWRAPESRYSDIRFYHLVGQAHKLRWLVIRHLKNQLYSMKDSDHHDKVVRLLFSLKVFDL